jgi:hypothetical protein
VTTIGSRTHHARCRAHEGAADVKYLDGWGYCSSGVRFRVGSELITDINDGGYVEGSR